MTGGLTLHPATLWATPKVTPPPPPASNLSVVDCPELDTERLRAVFELELSTQQLQHPERGTVQLPPVELSCREQVVQVTVFDHATAKILTRDVERPQVTDPTRERRVALAISELFVSSWLELLLPAETRPPEAAKPQPLPGPPPAGLSAAALSLAEDRLRPRRPNVAAWAEGTGHLRGLGDTLYGSLGAALGFEGSRSGPWAARLGLAVERASVSRSVNGDQGARVDLLQ